MLIKPILAATLETALTQYLALDEDSPLLLQPLAGKVIAIQFEPMNETLYFCPTDHHIQILENFQGQPDATIRGHLVQLGLLKFQSSPLESVFKGDLRIEGDTQTARHFQQLFNQLDIDLEDKLAGVTGDVVAHQIGNLFRRSQKWLNDSSEAIRLNSKEFLQEETRNLPAKPEVDAFCTAVDHLRSDFDRLQARIDQLIHLTDSL